MLFLYFFNNNYLGKKFGFFSYDTSLKNKIEVNSRTICWRIGYKHVPIIVYHYFTKIKQENHYMYLPNNLRDKITVFCSMIFNCL